MDKLIRCDVLDQDDVDKLCNWLGPAAEADRDVCDALIVSANVDFEFYSHVIVKIKRVLVLPRPTDTPQ